MKNIKTDSEKLVSAILKNNKSKAKNMLEQILNKKVAKRIKTVLN